MLASRAAYERALTPGHLWMPVLEGEHVSTDAAVVGGTARWWRHTSGAPREQGTFDYWTVEAEPRPALEEALTAWIARHLGGYTGCLNLETIGGTLIECHLRFADQWPDLYGSGWIEAVIALYAEGRWQYADADRRTGYSVVLFGEGDVDHRVDREAAQALCRTAGVASIQITFHDDKPHAEHAMPPGGFRLAVVNCWSLAAGLLVRERLRQMFRTTSAARSALRSAAIGRH
jgi:hypothetical protein